MNTTRHKLLMQRWNVIQQALLPELKNEPGALTPKRCLTHNQPASHPSLVSDEKIAQSGDC
jgi:hypothetical protein